VSKLSVALGFSDLAATVPDSLTYTVPGRPVTWKRDNFYRGRFITDKSNRQAKAAHQLHAVIAKGGQPWDLNGAFSVDVAATYTTAVVGDVDRLLTLVLDALQGVAFTTDRQVRKASASISTGPEPLTIVTVRRIGETVVKAGKAPGASIRPRASRMR
jgi:Holliday junction resolvase RusA-like endonuclease